MNLIPHVFTPDSLNDLPIRIDLVAWLNRKAIRIHDLPLSDIEMVRDAGIIYRHNEQFWELSPHRTSLHDPDQKELL